MGDARDFPTDGVGLGPDPPLAAPNFVKILSPSFESYFLEGDVSMECPKLLFVQTHASSTLPVEKSHLQSAALRPTSSLQ